MKNTIREEVEKEAFRICSEAQLRRKKNIGSVFTLVYSKGGVGWMGLSLFDAIAYQNPATISYLKLHGLITRYWPHKFGNQEFAVIFDFDKIQEWIKSILSIEKTPTVIGDKIPSGWGWSDKNNNKYQFGKLIFQQKGEIRGKVFREFMDIFEENSGSVSIKILSVRTGVGNERLRIEIDAINERLLKNKIGYCLKGSGKGYYTIEDSE